MTSRQHVFQVHEKVRESLQHRRGSVESQLNFNFMSQLLLLLLQLQLAFATFLRV